MTHPNDKLAAIDWALRKAIAEQDKDEVRLLILPALREMHADTLKEVRGDA